MPCKTLHSICTVVSVQCKNGVIILATIKHSTTCTPGLTMTIICFWLDEDKDKSLAAFGKTLWTAEGTQKRVMTRSKDERKTSKYGRVNDKKNKKQTGKMCPIRKEMTDIDWQELEGGRLRFSISVRCGRSIGSCLMILYSIIWSIMSGIWPSMWQQRQYLTTYIKQTKHTHTCCLKLQSGIEIKR